MRVLLFSNDLMPFPGLPTSGGGLRAYQIMRGLQAHGIEVLPSMPGSTFLAEKYRETISEEHRELFWRGDTQDDLVWRLKPDAIIFSSNWDHYSLSRKPDVPLIIDLHGSRLIENALWNSPIDRDRKVQIFGLADCMICAGAVQRNYFNGWLLQAGRIPGDSQFIRYIPISLSPEMPGRYDSYGDDFPLIVSGGGWFPWQNQSKAIFAVANTIERFNRGTFSIYGTPHQTDEISPAAQKISQIYEQVKTMAADSSRIRVHDYVSRDELIPIYARSHIALELMQYNLERELAFTTRTVEYLWSGLPVIYNDYSELSHHIKEYDAGWTLPPDDSVALALVLDEIFNHRDRVKEKSVNARRLVADRFTWDRTIIPLVEFLRNPTISPPAAPIRYSTYFLPPFLFPRGVYGGESLVAGRTRNQRFVMPAVRIKSLIVPLRIINLDPAATIEVKVRNSKREIFSQTFAAGELQQDSRVQIDLPIFMKGLGGSEIELSLQLKESGELHSDVRLLAIKDPVFPFIKEEGMETMCINFVPTPGIVELLREKVLSGLC